MAPEDKRQWPDERKEEEEQWLRINDQWIRRIKKDKRIKKRQWPEDHR